MLLSCALKCKRGYIVTCSRVLYNIVVMNNESSMKYAVMSDIHANPAALVRAVDDAEMNGVDGFICLGDIVGYGPYPNEAITLSREVFAEKVVLGNHDAAIVREMSMDSFSRRAQKSILAQRYMVDESNLDWLAARSHFIRERNLLFVHGDVSLDAGSIKAGFGYVFRLWK